MHSVSRSLLVSGIMALGGLTACGERTEVVVNLTPQPKVDPPYLRLCTPQVSTCAYTPNNSLRARGHEVIPSNYYRSRPQRMYNTGR